MGDGDELHGAELAAQIASDVQAADGQIRRAVLEHFFHAGQYLLAQPNPAATAFGHEVAEGADQLGAGVGGIDHQPHLGFPTLLHVVRQLFQLAGLGDQLSRAAQQHLTGLGQHRLAPVDA